MSTNTTQLTITSLLSSLQIHLQTQTELLPTLHAQLGLPPSALEDELTTLHQQLTECVEGQVATRQHEVDEWMEKCDGVERYCSRLGKALGGNAKVVSGSVGELRKQQVLPKRYEFLIQYQDKMKQLYQTKLEQLTTLTTRINNLVNTVGREFYTDEILEPTEAAGEDPIASTALRDLTPERFSRLEKELARGKTEITKRLSQLSETFVQIDWLYTELGIDPSVIDGDLATQGLDISPSLLHIPQPFSRSLSTSTSYTNAAHDDPFLSPTPASRRSRQAETADPSETYNRVFIQFVTQLDASPDGPIDITSLEGIDPTPGLVAWAHHTAASLNDLKARRETHIQALYDQLEALWRRLGVADSDMDAFVEAHRGSTAETVREYERELESMLELKRERMEVFVQNARGEIEKLWDELLAGEEERAAFLPFHDDEFSEDLLTIHEDEIKRLREEKRSKAPYLASIRKYFQICDEEKELAAAATDQSRLLGRGPRDPGRLLREEKMRKRVNKEKPRLEQDLITSVTAWEEESGYSFLVNGASILELLSETVAASDKETRRRNQPRPGSVPPARATTPSHNPPPSSQPSSRGKGPGGTGTVTPAVRPGTSMGHTGSNKRQRVETANSSMKRSVSSRAPLASSRYHVNSSPPAMLHHGKTPTATLYSAKQTPSSATAGSALPRPVSVATNLGKSMRGQPPPKQQPQHTESKYAHLGLGMTQAVKEQQVKTQRLAATTRQQQQQRHRIVSGRESFRPRPSIDMESARTVSGYSSAASRYPGHPGYDDEV